MVNILSEETMKKIELSFARRYQLQMTFWLEVRAHVYSPLLALGPSQLEPVEALHML